MVQGSQSTGSLFDFLYVDRGRASSIIAQLHSPGVATSVKHTSTDSDKSVKDVGVSVLGTLKGKAAVEEAISQTLEKHYDASWSLPINLLDKMDEAGLIKQGLDYERLGSTVYTKGRIRIFDINMMQKTIPFLGRLAQSNEPKLPPKVKKHSPKLEDLEIAPNLSLGMMTDVLNIVPNTLQVDFVDEQGRTAWMTINRDFLTVNPDDMALKYGGEIPGDWHIVGMIDALPDAASISNQQVKAEFPESSLKDGLFELLHSIRENAGRSASSYGITPLIIFRTIS